MGKCQGARNAKFWQSMAAKLSNLFKEFVFLRLTNSAVSQQGECRGVSRGAFSSFGSVTVKLSGSGSFQL